jgi:septal ring factor EnvC (AmiA/AmiB activator)
MEIIMTVLITLLVVALIVAGINLVRLNRKAVEHDMLQMEVIDVQNRIDRMIENLEKDLRQSDEDLHKDCLNRIEGVISSTDRRFDYVRNDIDKLDNTINSNKDLLKK